MTSKRNIFTILVFILIVAGTLPSQGQHYVGVRGGYGNGRANFYPKLTNQEMDNVWGLWNGGFSWKYYTKEKIAGGVEVDVLWMQQGLKVINPSPNTYQKMDPDRPSALIGDTTAVYERVINSVMIPLFWQPHVYMAQQRLRIYANLGVTLSYNFKQRWSWSNSDPEFPFVRQSGRYEMKTVRDNRIGYGLCGGVGMGWAIGRWEVVGEWRYYFGYSDVLKNRNQYYQNPLRSPLNGMQFSMALFYRLGKGGILSPPSERTAEKIRVREQKQARKRAERLGIPFDDYYVVPDEKEGDWMIVGPDGMIDAENPENGLIMDEIKIEESGETISTSNEAIQDIPEVLPEGIDLQDITSAGDVIHPPLPSAEDLVPDDSPFE